MADVHIKSLTVDGVDVRAKLVDILFMKLSFVPPDPKEELAFINEWNFRPPWKPRLRVEERIQSNIVMLFRPPDADDLKIADEQGVNVDEVFAHACTCDRTWFARRKDGFAVDRAPDSRRDVQNLFMTVPRFYGILPYTPRINTIGVSRDGWWEGKYCHEAVIVEYPNTKEVTNTTLITHHGKYTYTLFIMFRNEDHGTYDGIVNIR